MSFERPGILKELGLTPEIIRKYVIGYAPKAGAEKKYVGLEAELQRRRDNLAAGMTCDGRVRKNKACSK